MCEPVGKAWALDGTPRESAFAVLPPDWDRLAPFLQVAMRRFPSLADAGIRALFCGPESFTGDLSPMLGESPEVDGLYLTCGWEYPEYFAGPGVTPTVEWGFERGEAFERTREEGLW